LVYKQSFKASQSKLFTLTSAAASMAIGISYEVLRQGEALGYKLFRTVKIQSLG